MSSKILEVFLCRTYTNIKSNDLGNWKLLSQTKIALYDILDKENHSKTYVHVWL